jgi:hypothetical protein
MDLVWILMPEEHSLIEVYADAIVDVNNLKVKNNILQNLSQRGVNLSAPARHLPKLD